MIKKEFFGRTNDGDVFIYTLTNTNGLEMKVMNYGAVVVSLKVPDKKGVLEDIVLGFDSLDQYQKEINRRIRKNENEIEILEEDIADIDNQLLKFKDFNKLGKLIENSNER